MFNFTKKPKENNPGQVLIPVNHPNPPEKHEVDAAYILARHYRCVIEFIVPIDDFKRRTADIIMQNNVWEIKTPEGSSKYTIQKQIRRASKQAKNIIIDTRRTKLKFERIEKQALFEISKRPAVKKVILIDKKEKIVEIFK